LVPRPGEVAGGCDDLQVGVQGGQAGLEADLVVALAGAAVRHGGAAELLRGRHQVLDDQRPGQRRQQRVAVHVEGVGLHGGDAEVRGELLPGVHDDGLGRAARGGPLADGIAVLAALADVDGYRDDLPAGLLGVVRDGDGGVLVAGVRQYDVLAHDRYLLCDVFVKFRSMLAGTGPGGTSLVVRARRSV